MSILLSEDDLRKTLTKELVLKTDLFVEGVGVSKKALLRIQVGNKVQEQIHNLFERDFVDHDVDMPTGFFLPNGLHVPFRWNPRSNFQITLDNDDFVVTNKGEKLAEIVFVERPDYYTRQTSDGTAMSTVAVYRQDSCLGVCYSNECSFKEKGEDCLFCNINYTKDRYGESQGIFWKTPKQIGETVAAAYKDGIANHVTVTGGIIPERRELEYYLDVADEIIQHTGLDDFNGTATVAAPLDLSNINRLKEAGYRTTAMNIEIWDKNIYQAICPGKARNNGGWDHWLKALEYAVPVFGHGRVRSNIVAGIEPKKSTLEGLEYLAAKGIVGLVTIWCPNPGSGLEGHRSPEASWYLDLAYKLVAIWKKNGFTYDHIYDAIGQSDTIMHDIWKIQEGLFPLFRNLSKKAA